MRTAVPLLGGGLWPPHALSLQAVGPQTGNSLLPDLHLQPYFHNQDCDQLLFDLKMWQKMERVGKKILMNENFFL